MNTKDAIRFALDLSNRAVMSKIDEVADLPTAFPTAKGGCHPLWVLGHLTLIEGMIPAVLYGKVNPVEGWGKHFGEHTEPVGETSAYPSFREVRAKYLELREENLKLLESLTESDLDRATKAPPPGREKEFATFGQSFLVLALHQTMHRGQVTDALRTAGRVTPVAAAAGN
jgi:hypothetical protein